MRYLVSATFTATRSVDAVLCRAWPHSGTMPCWYWAISWVTVRTRTPWSTRARAHPAAIVRGNHDKVAAGLDDAEDFNPMARSAAHGRVSR